MFLGGTEKNHKKPQDSLSPGSDLNTGPPQYYVGVLTTRLRRSVGTLLMPVKYFVELVSHGVF
jgi:hypothetical protein